MSRRTLYIISYDISDDKKRNKVSDFLQNYGQRVQKSVFECFIDEKTYIEVCEQLYKMIDLNTDSIRLYPLFRRNIDAMEVIGNGPIFIYPMDMDII